MLALERRCDRLAHVREPAPDPQDQDLRSVRCSQDAEWPLIGCGFERFDWSAAHGRRRRGMRGSTGALPRCEEGRCAPSATLC